MNRIPPYRLWLGHAGDGRDFRRILDVGIQAIVYLAHEEPLPQVPRDLICCRFPILDGCGNRNELLHLALQTIKRLIDDRVSTLLACSAGMSRSPAMAAAALSIASRKPPEEMLTLIHQHNPCDLSPALWSEIKAALASL